MRQRATVPDTAGRPGKDDSSSSLRSGLLTALAAVVATAVSLATFDTSGTFSASAIRWLLLAGVGVGCILLLPLLPQRWPNRIPVDTVLMLCVLSQFAALLWSPVEAPNLFGSPSARPLMMSLAAAAVISGSLSNERSWLGRWAFPLLVVLQLVIGLLLIGGWPAPGLDVQMFQEGGCDGLLRGENPYAMTFPDPYPPELSARLYGPGVSVNGVLQYGYPYMPLLLLMPLAGHLLGDVRYASLLAAVLAGVLIAAARPGRAGRIGATLVMFCAIAPLVLYAAWTETYVLLGLALTWFCCCRRPAFTAYAFGLLLVSKQYMPALAPLGLLLLPRPWSWPQVTRFALQAGVAGSVVTLPFILWNPSAFYHSVVQWQLIQPFRPDALSFLVWLHPANPAGWLWLPFVLLGLMLAWSLWAGRKGQVPFPLAVGMCLFVFFAFNKQAFANYYYLVIGAFCCALAGGNSVPRMEQDSRAATGQD